MTLTQHRPGHLSAAKTAKVAIGVLSLALVFVAGCAPLQTGQLPPQENTADFTRRTLSDQGLKRFMEEQTDQALEEWPLREWDLQSLSLAALYFHTRFDPDRGVGQQSDPERLDRQRDYAWELRTSVRTNLVTYVAAQRREALLNELEEICAVLERLGVLREAAGLIEHRELSRIRLQLAEIRLLLIQTRIEKMYARDDLAASLALPVNALLDVQVTCDLSRTAPGNFTTRSLRQEALRHRPDVLSLLAQYEAAEAALRQEIAKHYPQTQLRSGQLWNPETGRWVPDLELGLPAGSHTERAIASVEARRLAAADCLLSLQAEIIDQLQSSEAVYRMMAEEVASIDALRAQLQQQHDIVRQRYKAGIANGQEMILAKLQVVSADLSQLVAQVKLQDALGALEDAMQQPAELIDHGPNDFRPSTVDGFKRDSQFGFSGHDTPSNHHR